MSNINIISHNVRGLKDNFKRRDVFRKLHEDNYDVIYLQETHSEQKDELRWKNEWGGVEFISVMVLTSPVVLPF